MAGVGPLAGAGRPRRREEPRPPARRVGSWLIWWVILMAFWTWIDDSILTAELIVGAVVAAIGATVAEVAQHQAASHIRIRAVWLGAALRLPLSLARDTVVVFKAAMAAVVLRRLPESGFAAYPVEGGDDSAEGATRRALILGGASVAPNSFALGIDREKDEMVVHHLVMPERAGRRQRQ